MRKLLLGVVVALIASGAARAADVAVAPVTKAPAIVPAAPIWSGFYIGGHAGHAWSAASLTFSDDTGNSEDFSFAPSSFMGGGQVGLQQQFDRWLLGIEGTWSSVNLNQTHASVLLPGQFRSITTNEIATVTGRFGTTWDQVMLYAKGGWAGVNIDVHSRDSVAGVTGDATGRSSGWTVGLGLDYMPAPSAVFGVEFDFYNLNFDRNGLFSDGTAFHVTASSADVYSVTARLSYLFNWAKH